MAKKNTGKELEAVVARVYEFLSEQDVNTTVRKDVKLESPDGLRQFDVVLETEIAQSSTSKIELLTVVEVRDYKPKLKVDAIDAFVSKMQDVKANKGIIVSRTGFQKGAVRKAKRLGIDLYTVQHLERLKDFQPQTPVVMHLVKFGMMRMGYSAQIGNPNFAYNFENLTVDDVPIFEQLKRDIASGKIKPTILAHLSDFERSKKSKVPVVGDKVEELEDNIVGLNIYTPPEDGVVKYKPPQTFTKLPVNEAYIKYQLYYEYFFGYLTDLPHTVAMTNILESTATVYYELKDLMNFHEHFRKIDTLGDIPVTDAANYFVMEDFESPGALPNTLGKYKV